MPLSARHLAAFVLALAAAHTPVALAQLAITEPPDLSNVTGTPTSIGALGLGDNTITGGVSAVMSGGFPATVLGDFTDAVSFTIPVGMAVTLVDLTITSFANSSGILGQPPNVQFVSPSAFVQCATSGTTAAAIPTPTGAFGPGTYTIAVLSGLNPADHSSGNTRSFNYTLRLRAQSMLVYNEGVGAAAADLGSVTPGISVGTLGGVGIVAGENRVGGTINTVKPPNQPVTGDQSDFFTFTVPAGGGAGLVVTGITVLMTDTGSTINCLAPRLNDVNTSTSVVLVTGSSLTFPIVGSVLAPGSYELQVYSSALGACSPFANLASRFTYAISIFTAADPAPGACCNRWTGHCITAYNTACTAMGMRYNGNFTVCSPVACAPCPADFNGSGIVSVQDIFDFLAAYFAGCP